MKVYQTPESIKAREILRNTLQETSKGRPVSRIEIYPSGANRIITSNLEGDQKDPPKRHKYDIVTFSDNARRRYWQYGNTLDLLGYNTYVMVATIQNRFCEEYIFKDDLKYIMKNFFKTIIRMGYDYLYKLEYHKNETPHIHLLFYSKDKILFSNKKDQMEKSSKFSKLFTDIVFSCPGYFNRDISLFDYQFVNKVRGDMSTVSCMYLDKPVSIQKTLSYYSTYTSKNKDYQNLIPKRFLGIKMWGRGRENYGRLNLPVHDIPITRGQFDFLYTIIRKKLNLDHKYFLKRNGFFGKELDSMIDFVLNESGVYSDTDSAYDAFEKWRGKNEGKNN